MGAVPTCLVPVLLALGAKVVYASRTPKPNVPAEQVALDALIRDSDIVSLHVPLTDDTEAMIDRECIARMKTGVVIVNTARGQLIDEAALVAGLKSGQIAAAALDVFDREPAEVVNPLFDLPNVIVSPHVAWLTPETLAQPGRRDRKLPPAPFRRASAASCCLGASPSRGIMVRSCLAQIEF